MNSSAGETSPAFALNWFFSLVESDPAQGGRPTMKFVYEIKASEEIYVSDRLWDYDHARRRVPDPFGVYRFVKDGCLRLLFGQAPWPPNVSIRVVYAPLYSRVLPGETRRGEVSLALPIDEYSSLARDIQSPTVTENVSCVTLLLDYRLRSDMTEDPIPPLNESAEAVGYIVHDPKRSITWLQTDAFPVKRRTGYIARVTLPGEPGPEPAPSWK